MQSSSSGETPEEAELANVKVKVVHPSILNVVKKRQKVKENLARVKHKIGIYSAKGGVGKTTVAVNLAFTLKGMGYKVGLVDADIDCPNLMMFLGMNDKAEGNYPLMPAEKDGVKVISTAMFVDDAKKPIIWRGPLVAKMVSDFFENTEWGDLDYLIIDAPPGTSDSNLSTMQLVELDGYVLVTTPQHIPAVNTIKSGAMARRLGVSVLGVIENMSNGNARGGSEVATELKCDLLGTVSLNPELGALSDSGKVPVFEDSGIREEFIKIAKRLISGG